MMGCTSICVSLLDMVFGLVCLCTQLILFQNICSINQLLMLFIPSANIKVPMVKNVFTFTEDQKLFQYALSFVIVQLML